MSLFISVISHGHDEMISSNTTLKSLAKSHTVFVKSNTQAKSCLKMYCQEAGIHLIQGQERKGFGANNNEVFELARIRYNMCDTDLFLVLNPDIELNENTLEQLLEQLENIPADISTINLFKDKAMTKYDHSIRHYPKLLNPLKTFLGIRRRDIYDKSTITVPVSIDWAAGSFLLFKAACYQSLKGFNERYFMYFEDADICTRANLLDYSIVYFPGIKAVHFASHQNRKLFSKHFIWYWCSSFRYHLKFIKKPSSKHKGLLS